MEFIRVNKSNIYKLQEFIDNAGNALQTFRYFNNRSLLVVENHSVTYLIVDKNKAPVCYGHLEKENEILWLGIAVIEKQKGKGLGKKMMQYLIDFAKQSNETIITLSVDKINTTAISFYKKFGFSVIKETENIIYMKKEGL